MNETTSHLKHGCHVALASKILKNVPLEFLFLWILDYRVTAVLVIKLMLNLQCIFAYVTEV